MITTKGVKPNTAVLLLGQPLREVELRLALEQNLRALAQLATGAEKMRLVD